MDTDHDTSDSLAKASAQPKWTFGQVFLILCLVSGCWGIVAGYDYIRKPPTTSQVNVADGLAQLLSLVTVVLSVPVLSSALRNKRPRRYSVMSIFEIGQFLVSGIVGTIVLAPAHKKGVDFNSTPLPVEIFWTAFALSIVEAIIAVLALGLPLDEESVPSPRSLES